jgi:hypothetical protein
VANMFERLSRWLRRKPAHLRYESPFRLKRVMEEFGLVGVRMHWIPILPSRLKRLQPMIESPIVIGLFHHVPAIGALLSHSCMLVGTKGSRHPVAAAEDGGRRGKDG